MSEKALTDTIYLEMKMLKENGTDWCYAVPGNYGMDFLRKKLHVDTALSVKCSNYVGETIEDAKLLGMKGILLIGHIGKFIKLAAGVMNTHSRQADCRMEVLGVHAAMKGADAAVVREIMDCINTTAVSYTHLKDKFTDSAVVVMDEKAGYVIPLLSGHLGGAVELSNQLAVWTGAVPVQTTATDVQGKFAVDVFAKKNHLHFTAVSYTHLDVYKRQDIILSMRYTQVLRQHRRPDFISPRSFWKSFARKVWRSHRLHFMSDLERSFR